MNAIGLVANAIDTVLITHMHPDHVGGLVDAGDQPVFPKARVLVPSGELDYWRGDIPEGAPEVLPGITRVPLPGHTPDHSGYRIVSGEDRILIWTDIVHLPGIQFPRPEATVAFD
ncbi:MBL fold metallo-hydrolase, partial [Halospina denitrificans]|uniref:MBL fold metallo-hydrolase n=1 Tax=Halospina denitrificans TaxID=332522 RepID=UPI00105F13ED